MILFLRTDGIIVCTDVRLHIYGTHTHGTGRDGRTDGQQFNLLVTDAPLLN